MELEQVKKTAYNTFCYSAMGMLFVLLVMLLAGDRFADTLTALGLYNEEDGIYADCNGPNAHKNRFCDTPRPAGDKTWKSIRGNVPFTLSGN